MTLQLPTPLKLTLAATTVVSVLAVWTLSAMVSVPAAQRDSARVGRPAGAASATVTDEDIQNMLDEYQLRQRMPSAFWGP